MLRRALLCLGLSLLFAAPAQAITIVRAGNWNFPNETPNNFITITSTNTANDMTAGMNFVVQIGDGVLGGKPLITGVDLITGTIFAGNNTGQFNTLPSQLPTPNPFSGTLTNPGVVYTGSVTTASGTVSTAGLLGTLKISTFGGIYGTWPLRLNKTAFPPVAFNFAPTAVTRIDGTITVDPEPSSLVIALIGAGGLAYFAYRRRRAIPQPRS
jgi:hypothetical protein